jgi:hypothetical protein
MVGDVVGFKVIVGEFVGETVGDCVGWEVGAMLGADVVGVSEVGFAVGAALGEAVAGGGSTHPKHVKTSLSPASIFRLYVAARVSDASRTS